MTLQNATFWGLCTQVGGYDSQIQARPSFLHNAPSPQVSSTYVYLCGSYRIDTQTHKHTHKQTNAAENIQRSSLRYDVR